VKTLSAWALAALLTLPALAADRADLATIMAIREEGIRRSKVMETASVITDRIGPRVTGSPAMNEANEWTRQQLEQWGMENARVERWEPFGRSWSYELASLRMVVPSSGQMYAIPKAWSPGTDGPVRAKAVLLNLMTPADLEKQKGKLAGMIVLNGEARRLEPQASGFLKRHDEKSLENIATYQIPGERGGRFSPAEYRQRREFQKALNEFLAAENVLAVIEPGSGGDGGTFDVAAGGSFRVGEPVGVPALVAATEHYNRVARILESGTPVELEVDVRVTMTDDAVVANTVAEIPGTDRKSEIVMLGAHLDSWHGGTGATDNGGASAVMMEAMRILKAVGVKPRRTIRLALWSGEEQGLLGSRAYVAQHFASRAEPADPADAALPVSMQRNPGALTLKPGHARLSAYFNLDNGAGKIRGIYAQENLGVVPIFRGWIEPLRDLGVTTVATRNTTGTDHLSFDAVGLPGFQFIQDEVEYGRTHHSNMDVYDRLQREDMIQAAVVVATFVYQAAMRDEMLPRKAMRE
jgi:carboxypeptidase Q